MVRINGFFPLSQAFMKCTCSSLLPVVLLHSHGPSYWFFGLQQSLRHVYISVCALPPMWGIYMVS